MPAVARHQVAALARDALAGLVIFLLGVPLAVGTSLASGMQAAHGLIAAAVGGLACGLLGGAPLMVTGPVVTLAVLTLEVSGRLGVAAMCAATALAGLLQCGMAAARVGRLALAVDAAILEGLLSSIGLQLVVAQLGSLCGARPQPALWRGLAHLPGALAGANVRDLAVGGVTIAIVVAWNRLPARRYVPAVLVATVAVTAALALGGVDGVRRVTMPSGGLATLLPDWGTALAAPGAAFGIVRAAVELALVGTLYSLLSALTVDRLHAGPRARLDRELLGQGAANLISGLLGGLPVSGAVLRSTANIQAGATGRAAVMFQGALMALALTALGGLLGTIPVACLAAFFVLLGAQLMRPARLGRMLREPPLLARWGAALAGALAGNLIWGVACGLAVSAWQLGRAALQLTVQVAADGPVVRVRLAGVACFATVPQLSTALARVPRGAAVLFCDETRYIDATAAALLVQWRQAHEAAGGSVAGALKAP